MRTVMIVDDESMARQHIRDSFPWQDWGLQIVHEAGNGADALEIIRQHPPNIVLIDITMPVMDGLTLLDHIRWEFPKIRCILITAHREFGYIQKAMQHGAVGYILKSPIHLEEAQSALDRACRQLDQESKHSQSERDHLMLLQTNQYPLRKNMFDHILTGLLDKEQDIVRRGESIGVHLGSDVHLLVVCEIDQLGKIKQRYPDKDLSLIEFSLLEIVRESLNTIIPGQFELFPVFFGRFVIVYNEGRLAQETSIDNLPFRMERAIEEPLMNYMTMQLCMAASGPFQSFQLLKSVYARTVGLLAGRFYQDKPRAILQQEAVPFQVLPPAVLEGLSQQLSGIASSFSRKAWMEWVKQTKHYLLMVKPESESVKAWFHSLKNLFRSEDQAPLPPWPPFPQAVSLHECFDRLVEWVSAWEQLNNRTVSIRPDIARAVQFIKLHLSEDLTLDSIASQVELSASHLGHLFKKEIGTSVIDYVLEQRIEQAKKYIAEGKHRNYELAEKVGFRHYSHFSTMFKKMTGLSPSEYKRAGVRIVKD